MAQGPLLKFSLSLAMLALLVNCAGAEKPRAKATAEPVETTTERKPKPAPKKSGPDCSDGTCIPCGDADCPKGFFCDESTAKPTCQWVPTCPDAATCACVERAFSDQCSCTERDGGAYLRCSE